MNSSVSKPEHRAVAPDKYLFGAVLVSLVGSACCIGPFFLLATGISGAWMSQLMMLEAYQPLFAILVLALFGVAAWNIFGSSYPSVDTGDSCSIVQPRRLQKFSFFFASAVAAILLTSEYWIPILG